MCHMVNSIACFHTKSFYSYIISPSRKSYEHTMGFYHFIPPMDIIYHRCRPDKSAIPCIDQVRKGTYQTLLIFINRKGSFFL